MCCVSLNNKAMRYRNLNALPHVLPYILSVICLVLGYLRRVTTRCSQFFKRNIKMHFFINLPVLRVIPFQTDSNHIKLKKNIW